MTLPLHLEEIPSRRPGGPSKQIIWTQLLCHFRKICSPERELRISRETEFCEKRVKERREPTHDMHFPILRLSMTGWLPEPNENKKWRNAQRRSLGIGREGSTCRLYPRGGQFHGGHLEDHRQAWHANTLMTRMTVEGPGLDHWCQADTMPEAKPEWLVRTKMV